jgi:hypothetical protein
LAKPGLSGFSSNSSWQMAQTRIGNDISIPMIKPVVWPKQRRADGGREASTKRLAKNRSERLLAKDG